MADQNPLNYVPYFNNGNLTNVSKLDESIRPISDAGLMIHYAPQVAKNLYDDTPLAEIGAEVLAPWQYKAYKDAMNKGGEYHLDPSALSADILEMLGPTAPIACGVEAMDNAFDDGENYDTAVSRALGVGAGVGLASVIPFGGKVLKFGEKIAPHVAKAMEKAYPKLSIPASIGTMMVAPSIVEGAMADEDEADTNIAPINKDWEIKNNDGIRFNVK